MGHNDRVGQPGTETPYTAAETVTTASSTRQLSLTAHRSQVALRPAQPDRDTDPSTIAVSDQPSDSRSTPAT
jgi:hypothetical protein